MNKEFLDEREFELVNIVGADLASNQRDLSRHLDLSLGQTNMLIRRLITKGYIRITQLNKKKVKYLLTPKGIAEKMRKSIKYTLKTISSIGLINDRLQASLKDLIMSGERNFVILGKSDFAFLVEMAIRRLCPENECKVTHIEELKDEFPDSVLLICKEDFDTSALKSFKKSSNLIEELAKDSELIHRKSE
ncbi:MAG: winged helix-turn-helix transcriptional regulator [Candidatus Omnitrophica bacterium]|nr:winged helix-turn-helix transcriptional regulator [Candidatus Omnitrophota bacterium]